MKTLTEKRFFEWHEDDISVTLRNKGGSYGGGSEVLVICTRPRYIQPMHDGVCGKDSQRKEQRCRPCAMRSNNYNDGEIE